MREIPNLKHADSPDPVIPAGQDLRAAASLPPVPIGFQNSNAVSVAMTIAGLAMLVSIFAPLPVFLQFIWRTFVLIVAGFVAVYLYHRRTGEFLTLRGGVRLGWLTGIFSFLIAFVIGVAGVLAESSTKGGLTAIWKSQIDRVALSRAEADQVMRVLESPIGIGAILFMGVAFIFVMSTALPMLGGALGAKVLEKED